MRIKTVSLTLLALIGILVLSACGTVQSVTGLLEEAPTKALAATTESLAAIPAQGLPPVEGSADFLAAYQGTLENLYKAVNPSVVNIRVVQKVDASDALGQLQQFPFFNLPQGQEPPEQYQSGLGSGFVWDEDGHIVTNNHVINGADKIEVTFSDGSIVSAEVVGSDPDSDLAVLKVDVPASELVPVQLADSQDVSVGQLAIAIGNPFGLQGTMTTGIVSAIGRSIPASETSAQSYTIPDVIQTDAPINPGNSGGVLVDVSGRVVGVTAAIQSTNGSNAGIGFAIPSSIVSQVVPALIKDGKFVHSWLGISGTNMVPDLAKAMDLPEGQRGALVIEVIPDSPAEKAGLRGSEQTVTIDGQEVNVGGDVITAIDGQSVNGISDLIAYLASSTAVGQKVELSLLRDGEQDTVDVTLAARPTSEQGSNQENPRSQRGITLGLQGLNMDEAIAGEMNLPNDQQGVLVEQVEPGSLADDAGLRGGDKSVTLDGEQVQVGGDIIVGVNGQPVATVGELRAALSQLPVDEQLTLTILRDGSEMEITIDPTP
ncbi:MAG: hypothetical protein A2Z16_11005 [Chloroflexi bacterium RBG_16_54_18]|nr:MAG: hypothetical protein A2Z16_11005 [Chloroflexi bacterium RBG_16_54_18]